MTVSWKLKSFVVQKRGIFTASYLREMILKQTGVDISIQALCRLVNGRPSMIRFETMEILCTVLECELSDFCQITPSKQGKRKQRKLSFRNTPKSKIAKAAFPSPQDYT